MYNCIICQVMKYVYCSSRLAMITAFLESSYIFVRVFQIVSGFHVFSSALCDRDGHFQIFFTCFSNVVLVAYPQ